MENDHIFKITVNSPNFQEVDFKVKDHIMLYKVFHKFALLNDIEVEFLEFLYKGVPLMPDKSVGEYCMKDTDTIKVLYRYRYNKYKN